MKKIFKNIRILEPQYSLDTIQDMECWDGQDSPNTEVLDGNGKILCPGFIDMHVHLRDPGQTWKETIAGATASARRGGFATVVAMPNTVPAIDSWELLREMEERFRREAKVEVIQAVCISRQRDGLAVSDGIAQVGSLRRGWVFSDDGTTPQDRRTMEQAMRLVAQYDGVVIDHCEEKKRSDGGVMHEGRVSRQLGVKGQPREAEENIVRRDIELCKETGCRIHLQHLSSAGSVALLRTARSQGLPVTGEVTPHHLLLTDQACLAFGTNAKMAPPLREESDRQALIEAVADGTITVIASDHAPHTAEEKARGWEKAPFGIVGIEWEIPLVLTELVERQNLPLETVVRCFTTGPREVLRMPGDSIVLGEKQIYTLLEKTPPYTISLEESVGNCRNCPYEGMECCYRASVVEG